MCGSIRECVSGISVVVYVLKMCSGVKESVVVRVMAVRRLHSVKLKRNKCRVSLYTFSA